METAPRRTMASLSGPHPPRQRQTLSFAELNLLARKIAYVDAVTFAEAHEHIESFMGSVDRAAPRSSSMRTNNNA
jgi:hypothetical protein